MREYMVTDIVRIREAEVYRTAAFLFNKRGYSSTSIRQICRTIGIRESSLYHYIRSKEDLLLNICERAMKKGLEVIEPIAKADLRPDQKLKKMVDTHMAMLARNSNEHYSMIKEIRSLSPARRLKVTHLRDRYETLFQR